MNIKYNKFNTISDFLKMQENCIWCGQHMSPLLTNYSFIVSEKSQPKIKIPIFKSKFIENKFEFKINFCSSEHFIKSSGGIDIFSNELTFDVDESSRYNGHIVDYLSMVDIFERLDPRVELHCNNNACGMNYYISSRTFSCEKASDKFGGAYYNFGSNTRINPISCHYEASNVDKYWIQNDFLIGKTCIFSLKNVDASPIFIDMLNFSSFDKEKFKSRIKTIITYT